MKRILFVSAYAAVLTACTSAPTERSGLSRIEVRADVAMWQRSGMDHFYRGRGPIDVFSPAYRRSYAEYQRLKNGPEYQAEVERLRAEAASKVTD